jgi:hypothetical protein
LNKLTKLMRICGSLMQTEWIKRIETVDEDDGRRLFHKPYIWSKLNQGLRKEIELQGKTVPAMLLSLLVISALALAYEVQPVETGLSPLIGPEESAVMQRTRNLASQEPPPTQWNRTYGGTGYDGASSVVQTSDGGYALAGTTNSYDMWLVKTSIVGTMQWNRTYAGTPVGGANSVVQTSDGGYALAGYTGPSYANTYDMWLVKTEATGNMQWNTQYGSANFDDGAYSVVQTSDGGYALAGYTRSFGEGSGADFWLIKTNATGNMQWNRTYGVTEFSSYAFSVVQTSDGGYALAGTTKSFGAGDFDFWLVKTDATGNMQWNETYGGTDVDMAYALVQTSDGGYALAGMTGSFGAGSFDFWLVKTDAAGTMQWNATYGGTGQDGASALVQTSDGGYALLGDTESFGVGAWGSWLVKTDAAGTMQWNATYRAGTGWDDLGSMVQTRDGGYALAGTTNSFGAGSYDMWLVKVESETGPSHDVAVTDVTAKTVVGLGYSVPINVIVANLGDYAEDFNLTLYVGSTSINDEVVSLPSVTDETLTFTWNTTGFAKSNYTVSAYAWPVPGETHTSDNNFTGRWVIVSMVGDLTGGTSNPWDFVPDGKVDGKDITVVALCFGSAPGCPPPYVWNPNCDVNNDGKIDGKDIATVALHYGQADP